LHICDNSGFLCVISTCTTHCAMAQNYHRIFLFFFVIFSKSTHTNELYDKSVMLFQTEGGHVTSINLKKKEKRCSMEIGIATTTLYKGLHIALSNQIISLHSYSLTGIYIFYITFLMYNILYLQSIKCSQ